MQIAILDVNSGYLILLTLMCFWKLSRIHEQKHKAQLTVRPSVAALSMFSATRASTLNAAMRHNSRSLERKRSAAAFWPLTALRNRIDAL